MDDFLLKPPCLGERGKTGICPDEWGRATLPHSPRRPVRTKTKRECRVEAGPGHEEVPLPRESRASPSPGLSRVHFRLALGSLALLALGLVGAVLGLGWLGTTFLI